MAAKDFEVQQLLKAYRKGLISDDLFEAQMRELGESLSAAKEVPDVANVFAYRGKSYSEMLHETPRSYTGVFTVPAGFSSDQECTYQGDQIIYVVEGSAAIQVSGKERDLKAGDVLMIPAECPYALRTGSESFFGIMMAERLPGTPTTFPPLPIPPVNPEKS